MSTHNPNFEHIYSAPSFDGSDGLLAIIIRKEYKPGQPVVFLTPPELPQQVGYISYPDRYVIKPHTHKLRNRTINLTQETLIIRKGQALLTIYDLATEPHQSIIRQLRTGDVAVLVRGGHSLNMLEDCEILEIKQGPYATRQEDKEELKIDPPVIISKTMPCDIVLDGEASL